MIKNIFGCILFVLGNIFLFLGIDRIFSPEQDEIIIVTGIIFLIIAIVGIILGLILTLRKSH